MSYIGKSPTQGVRQRYYFTATGGETSLSGADDNSKTLIFSDGEYIDVSLNGVALVAGTDYNTTTANTIGGLAALAASDIVEVVVYDIFSVADTVSASAGGTFQAGITVNGTVTASDLTVDTNTLYVDSTNNRVGIGTTSPSLPLHINGSSAGDGIVYSRSGTEYFRIDDTGTDMNIKTTGGGHAITFNTSGSEAARIDSSGNLLVGKTSVGVANVGAELRDGVSDYSVTGVSSSSAAALFGRNTDDGDVIRIRKDNSTVGSIGTLNADPWMARANGCGVRFITAAWMPTNATGNDSDNVVDLGQSGVRFDDIYATNGTIQTSDANEKQQIASLTDAEITAAKAISQLFKTFKWNDSVAEKGDAARTHTGVIAQDVQQAMTDAGLDAGDYAFFISTTWWETQTDVPAVAEVLDDDGNVVTEAKEAYTRTDTYDTAEEAPEGATERTRLGVRYPELLAFIGAATEQRLANIETRLAALENV